MVQVTVIYKITAKNGSSDIATTRRFCNPYVALGFLSSISNMITEDKDLILIKTDVEVVDE